LLFICESEVSCRKRIETLSFSFLDTEELKEEQVNGTDDGIFISWEPRHMYDSYIIDWCNFPMLQLCDLQWKRFGPHTSSTLINSGENQTLFLADVCAAIFHAVGIN